MKTVTIQIGNSDDKLTQKEWSAFVSNCDDIIEYLASKVHFYGLSFGGAPWQNAAWVIEIEDDDIHKLNSNLSWIGSKYKQNSVAITIGETKLLDC